MNKEETVKFIVAKVNDMYAVSREINLEKPVVDELGMDSLDCVELAMDIEKELAIVLPDSVTEEWKYKSINQIADDVSAVVQSKAVL